MKITFSNKYETFDDLQIGDVFRFNEQIYI